MIGIDRDTNPSDELYDYAVNHIGLLNDNSNSPEGSACKGNVSCEIPAIEFNVFALLEQYFPAKVGENGSNESNELEDIFETTFGFDEDDSII